MIYPLWLKIWLGGLGGIVLIGCVPSIYLIDEVMARIGERI